MAAAVPTVWQALLSYLDTSGKQVTSLKRAVTGGSACPKSLMEAFEEKHEVYFQQGWGMTELSPLGAIKSQLTHLRKEEMWHTRTKVSKPIFGVDVEIVDEEGAELPWNGEAFGSLKVRGPNVCSEYYKLGKTDAHSEAGWFDTGDVATINQRGYVQITDRFKDMIKSGGDWIGTIEIENVAMVHPAIAQAAVIGVAHGKWGERLLLCVEIQNDAELSKDEMLGWFDDKFAKWCVPDDCLFLEALPMTATGKVSKKDLREPLNDYRFPH